MLVRLACADIPRLCEQVGRKRAILIGWIFALPMPFMVIFAQNWWSVALSNLFLGIQQALVRWFMSFRLTEKHIGGGIH